MDASTMQPQRSPVGSRTHDNPDPYKWLAFGVMSVLILTLPAILVFLSSAMPEPPAPPAHFWATQAVAIGVDPSEISAGQTHFKQSCALCHGKDAQGVARLGKPLRNSAYVQEHTDSDLFGVISTGRLPSDEENTTGAVMPARANKNLGDEQINSVIVYLRAIQDTSQPTVSIEDWIIDTSGGAMAGLPGGIGHDLFVASCSACHGAQGEGMDGLGKPLDTSLFVEGKSDDELMSFVKTGRPLWDAENTTGLDMPSKGGNPALTDEQLADIVTYIRSLHE